MYVRRRHHHRAAAAAHQDQGATTTTTTITGRPVAVGARSGAPRPLDSPGFWSLKLRAIALAESWRSTTGTAGRTTSTSGTATAAAPWCVGSSPAGNMLARSGGGGRGMERGMGHGEHPGDGDNSASSSTPGDMNKRITKPSIIERGTSDSLVGGYDPGGGDPCPSR
jgi:hypothetical protein